MPTLANAIRTEQWEVSAVLLVRTLLELALRVPAGSPIRSGQDFSSMSTQEKIAYALAQRHL